MKKNLIMPLVGIATGCAAITPIALTSCKNNGQPAAITFKNWYEGTVGTKGIGGETDLYNIELNKVYTYKCTVGELSKGKTLTCVGECYFQTGNKEFSDVVEFSSLKDVSITVGTTKVELMSESNVGILYFKIPSSAKDTDELTINVKYAKENKDSKTILNRFEKPQLG